MNWIEIIELRSIGNELAALKQTLAGMLSQIDQTARVRKMSLYHNGLLETDISIHIQWRSGGRACEKSDLGLRLASVLGTYGRVNHSVWLEEKGDEQ